MYSSYYANYRNFPEGYKLVVITNPYAGKLKDLSLTLRELEPNPNDVQDLKNGKITEEEFSINYEKKLYKLPDSYFLTSLKPNNIFLSYEKKGEFGHRKLFTYHILKRFGFKIEEL